MLTKADKTRQFIIEQAAPLINRKGMAGTSISDIMEVTKLAKGGIYGNFENKEEICAKALDYLLEKAAADISARLSAKATYKEKLLELFEYYKDSLVKDESYGCPMLNFGVEADDTNPGIKERVSKAITDIETLMIKLVKKGISAGEFKKDFAAEPFAIKAFAMLEGGMWISRIQNSNKQMRLIIDILTQEIEEYTR